MTANSLSLYLPYYAVKETLRGLAEAGNIGKITRISGHGGGEEAAFQPLSFFVKGVGWVRDQRVLGYGAGGSISAKEIAALEDELSSFGLSLDTAGGCAVDLLGKPEIRASLGLGPLKGMPTPFKSSWARDIQAGIFGGRQELFWRYKDKIDRLHKIDQVGSYASIMASNLLPCERPIEARPSQVAEKDGYDWFVEATVEVNADPGPLPYRTAGGQVCYPSGRWRGLFWLSEILNGGSGVTILQIHKADLYRLSDYLQATAQFVLDRRQVSESRWYWKSVAVKLTGLLGQTAGQKRYYINKPPKGDGSTRTVFSLPGFEVIESIGKPAPRDWTRIHAYSLLLSLCRQKTYRALKETADWSSKPTDNLLACHTDGIWQVGAPLLPEEPGWRIDAERRDFFGDAPIVWSGTGAGTWKIYGGGYILHEAKAGYTDRAGASEGRRIGKWEAKRLHGGRIWPEEIDGSESDQYRTIQPIIEDRTRIVVGRETS